MLRHLARIIASVSDRIEGNDQSIPEPDIASVVQVPREALSKATADPTIAKLEEMLKAEFGDVNDATPAKSPLGRSAAHSVRRSLSWTRTTSHSANRTLPSLAIGGRR